MQRVGIDIGGTFTDLVGLADGGIVVEKRPTTPDDPTRGVADCMESAGADVSRLAEFLHGTTIAINTVLERKGAITALLTTAGFRDVYEIGRGNRPEAFDLEFRRPRPLVPRERRLEIRERVGAGGEILIPIDPAEVERIGRGLTGIDAVAVCFLHAYANAEHERVAGAILRRLRPDLFVTLSHEILREYREYERTSTTVLNAYVGPRVRGYLDRLERYLGAASFTGRAEIMRSNGGTMSFAQARREPVSIMESGPAAGMIATGHLARLLGLDRCIGFDMGGTTAKATLIDGGVPGLREGYFIGGYASGQPMQLPVVDIVEVGAGGGSIAGCDEQGNLRVGPASAGAEPGPACYRRGGVEPVVTDADLVLGRLGGDRFLGGAMGLDRGAAERAIRDRIAGPLGLTVADAALGIVRIADASMSLAVRAVSVERGCDPRDCAMVAFGGAGPLHAAALAREIFVPTVVIPRYPGTFSALGILLAPWREDLVQTFVAELGAVDAGAAERAFATLGADGREHAVREGMDPASPRFSFAADLRYRGQEHTIPVPVGGAGELHGAGAAALARAFGDLHERRYGHAAPDQPIEMVNLRLAVTVPRAGNRAGDWLAAGFTPEDARPAERREVVFDDPDHPLPARIEWRPGLASGTEIEGPAVIEEPSSTTLLFPGDRARITEHGHLIITLAGDAAPEEAA